MPPMLPMLVATGELEFVGGRAPLARESWREKRKPANRVPSSFSKRDVRNCRPRPCGSASRFTSSWRLDAVIGLSRCLSHQTQTVGYFSPTTVALLCFTDASGRILGAERNQRIPHPVGRALEASQRPTWSILRRLPIRSLRS